MNGLTAYELRKLNRIRDCMDLFNQGGDRYWLFTAKHEASRFIAANKRRKAIRSIACRSVRGLHSHFPKENT